MKHRIIQALKLAEENESLNGFIALYDRTFDNCSGMSVRYMTLESVRLVIFFDFALSNNRIYGDCRLIFRIKDGAIIIDRFEISVDVPLPTSLQPSGKKFLRFYTYNPVEAVNDEI